ncbi:MAG: tRNA pseudouridine(55) synthase TruB [Pseudomonadota bacterium]
MTAATEISGFLLLDKPVGMTSRRALTTAMRLLGTKKGGHGGCLDPFATGLLPLYFGQATRFADEGLGSDKTYDLTIQLGTQTDTADLEGAVIKTLPVPPLTETLCQDTLAKFLGPQLQKPPQYSALKHEGKPLYAWARDGVHVEKPARPIEIYEIILLGFDESRIQLRARCSKGTYLRVLAESVADALGTCAHASALRRVGLGTFDIAEGVTLETLEQTALEDRHRLLCPISRLLSEYPTVHLTAEQAKLLLFGQRLSGLIAPEGIVQVCSDTHWLGLAHSEGGALWVKRLLATPICLSSQQ